MFKNGIYGMRYKGYYIQKGEGKSFSIFDEDAQPLNETFDNTDDCQWYIDKKTASAEELAMMQRLYSKEIYDLSVAMVRFMEKKNSCGLNLDEEQVYMYVEKIRKRKAENKDF